MFEDVALALIEALPRDILPALFADHEYLFNVDANERSITHWLACYLQLFIDDQETWEEYDLYVDVEYNRLNEDPKRVLLQEHAILDALAEEGAPSFEDVNARTVFPDIIVHRRGGRFENCLAIEFKKQEDPSESDLRKLMAYIRNQNDGGLEYARSCFVGWSPVTREFSERVFSP